MTTTDLDALDASALARTLPSRRWFGGKGRPIASVRAVDRVVLGPALSLWAIEVLWADGGPKDLYVLPLRPGSEDLSDALAGDAAALALLDALRAGRELQSARGTLRAERFDAPTSTLRPRGASAATLDELGLAPPVQRLSAEQSNTSIAFGRGGGAIVKLLRRLEGGPSPELEIGAHLARIGFAGAPALLGALAWEGPASGTVAVAHRFVDGAESGWDWALRALATASGPATGALQALAGLGAATAALHLALADARGDPEFAPVPLQPAHLREWSRSIARELEQTIGLAAAAVPALRAHAPALRARLAALDRLASRLDAANGPGAGMLLRQHGDLHLGQVLRQGDRWLIFDFEGEPLRPLAERRRKAPPVKDLAGLLRSISYAEAAAARAGSGSAARGPPAAAGVARQALLDGYLGAQNPLLPQDPAAFGALLDAAELEKLLYELRYELGHRPDWVEIPARDLLAQEPR